MNDRAVSLFDHYEIEIEKTKKGRGAILVETKEGTKTLKEYFGTEEKALLQDALMDHIKKTSFSNIDCFMHNKEGNIVTKDYEGKSYIVKDFLEGKECNVFDRNECKRAVTALAKLHKTMQGFASEYPLSVSKEMLQNEFVKRNLELQRARSYIRKTSRKNDFEMSFLKNFDYFKEQTAEAAEYLNDTVAERLSGNILEKGTFCHGDFNQHNVLLDKEQVKIINFEKFKQDVQARDLYLFLRKVLEKNNWTITLGTEIMEAYQSELPLTREEIIYVYARLLYPEKFWKVANGYLNRRKSLPAKRQNEKLLTLMESEEKRTGFLKEFLHI